MAARASATGVITFSLVSIPVKLYLAAKDESVKFRLITPENNPIKQDTYDPISKKGYTYAQCYKGYEYEKDKFVLFKEDELKALAVGNKGFIEIINFVPEESLDLVYTEKSYYVKPDKGGDKAFKLLAEIMASSKKLAIGKWGTSKKQHLVAIRAYKGGLLLHQLFYSNEVRDYDDNCAHISFNKEEKKIALQLVKKMSKPTFDAKNYRDEFSDKVIDAVAKKRKDKSFVVSSSEVKSPGMDLFAALAASLEASENEE